mmetsp:Transcript_34925/g.78974  ORF Transcript_34925/g.78974 Transcript_34925/m.78974 type:complete len:120 (+) Transcript_34925:516-875(+)
MQQGIAAAVKSVPRGWLNAKRTRPVLRRMKPTEETRDHTQETVRSLAFKAPGAPPRPARTSSRHKVSPPLQQAIRKSNQNATWKVMFRGSFGGRGEESDWRTEYSKRLEGLRRWTGAEV